MDQTSWVPFSFYHHLHGLLPPLEDNLGCYSSMRYYLPFNRRLLNLAMDMSSNFKRKELRWIGVVLSFPRWVSTRHCLGAELQCPSVFTMEILTQEERNFLLCKMNIAFLPVSLTASVLIIISSSPWNDEGTGGLIAPVSRD